MIPNRLFFLILLNILVPQYKNLYGMDSIELLSKTKSSEELVSEKYSIDKILIQAATDLILLQTRTFKKNIKRYNTMKENKEFLGTLYKEFKKDVIKQGIQLDSLNLSLGQWEKNKQLIKNILAKKITQSTQLALSQDNLKDEIKKLTEEQQNAVFESFSSPLSLRSIYLAFSHLKNGEHNEIKKALVDHTIIVAQENIKQKLPTIGFILTSVLLWCTHHKFPKRVQEVLTPLYQLLAIAIFGAKTF